jgi:protein-disulfide isomerase
MSYQFPGRGRLRFAMWLLPLMLIAPWLPAATPAAKADDFDPRLGAPFEKRDRPSLGSAQAPIVVIEFGSYKCSHCEEFHERVFPELKERYVDSGKVQWFMVPTSDNGADESGRIFVIGRCIQRQGKFWDSLDFLMKISNKPPSFLDDLVSKNSAIDSGELAFCLQDRQTRLLVSRDFAEYHLLKVTGTPTFFIRMLRKDGTRTEAIVKGYQPAEYFQRIFDQLLKSP